MTRDELLLYHSEVCKEAQELMSLKNRDYAGNDGQEPFANFTRVESMGICTTEQGFMTRITDKLSRLSSFLESVGSFVFFPSRKAIPGVLGSPCETSVRDLHIGSVHLAKS